MNNKEFNNKYNQALRKSHDYFSSKISEITNALLKEISPKNVNLQTFQSAIKFSLKINEISEQRTYFILKQLFTNQDDS